MKAYVSSFGVSPETTFYFWVYKLSICPLIFTRRIYLRNLHLSQKCCCHSRSMNCNYAVVQLIFMVEHLRLHDSLEITYKLLMRTLCIQITARPNNRGPSRLKPLLEEDFFHS